jgi:hypothetical protein
MGVALSRAKAKLGLRDASSSSSSAQQEGEEGGGDGGGEGAGKGGGKGGSEENEDVDKSFTPEEIFKLYPQPKGKDKSPEEIAKSKLEKEKLNQDIKSLLDIEREFDTFDEAKQKINQFINS